MASSEVQLCINSRVEYVSCPRVELISLAVVADEGVLHWKLDASYCNYALIGPLFHACSRVFGRE